MAQDAARAAAGDSKATATARWRSPLRWPPYHRVFFELVFLAHPDNHPRCSVLRMGQCRYLSLC
uniref:Uncharacterized protein n=1 Tax=Oryza nivara TaxID=4536 RepID=A0A0E0HQ62_ORYNI